MELCAPGFALVLLRAKACFRGRKFFLFLPSINVSRWFHGLGGYSAITIKNLDIYY